WARLRPPSRGGRIERSNAQTDQLVGTFRNRGAGVCGEGGDDRGEGFGRVAFLPSLEGDAVAPEEAHLGRLARLLVWGLGGMFAGARRVRKHLGGARDASPAPLVSLHGALRPLGLRGGDETSDASMDACRRNFARFAVQITVDFAGGDQLVQMREP